MKYPTPPQAPVYQSEKPNHTRTVTKTLAIMLVYHGFSMLIYRLLFSASVNQLARDEHWARASWTMFGFALVSLLVIAAVFPLLYFKDGDRKRAYLTATSVEVRGAEHTAEGYARYRKLARKEGLICTLATGVLWLIPALFYTIFNLGPGLWLWRCLRLRDLLHWLCRPLRAISKRMGRLVHRTGHPVRVPLRRTADDPQEVG